MNRREQVLSRLADGPAKVTVICRCTGAGETTVRKILKDLESAGLVNRQPDGLYAISDASGGRRGGRKPGQRDASTVNRDATVLDLLQRCGQLSREEIAEALEIATGIAYLSLYRLRRDGRVEQVRVGTRIPDWRAL